MVAPIWNLRELIILLNICNEGSVALSNDGSRLAGLRINVFERGRMKLVLYHVYPIPFVPGAFVDPSQFPTKDLSEDVQQIWNFLGVRMLNLDHQFERPEEVFEIVMSHRFFNIARMTQRLAQLQMGPGVLQPQAGLLLGMRLTDRLGEYQILYKFMAWWFRGFNVHTRIRDSNYIQYDVLVALCLQYFGTGWIVFRDWRMQCVQVQVNLQRIQTPQHQQEVNDAP